MHRFRHLIAAAAVVALLSLPAFAEIGAGHKHNFIGTSYATDTGVGSGASAEKCKACHIPHNATQTTLIWAKDYTTPLAWQGQGNATLCMGCHDGQLAGGASLPASANITTGNNHPVNVQLPSGSAWRDPSGSLPVSPGEMVVCGSCHDPHGSNGKMLWISNAGSALCTACHVK